MTTENTQPTKTPRMQKGNVTLRGKVAFQRDMDNKIKTWEYSTGKDKVDFGELGKFAGIKASEKGSGYYGTRIPFLLEIAEGLDIRCNLSQWLHPNKKGGEDGPLGFDYYANGNPKTVPFAKRNKLSLANPPRNMFSVSLTKDPETGAPKTGKSFCLFDLYPYIEQELKEDMWVEVTGTWSWSLYQNQEGEWKQSRGLDVQTMRISDNETGFGVCSQELILSKDSWVWNEADAKQGFQRVSGRVIYTAEGEGGVKGPHAFNFPFKVPVAAGTPTDQLKAGMERMFTIKDGETRAIGCLFGIKGGMVQEQGKTNEYDPFAGDGSFDEEYDGVDLLTSGYITEEFVLGKPDPRYKNKNTWTEDDYYLSVYTSQENGEVIDLEGFEAEFGGVMMGDMFGGAVAQAPVQAPTATDIIQNQAPVQSTPVLANASVGNVEVADDALLDDLFV